MALKVLLTGGAGYIGSHTLIALTEAGFDCVVVDNFSNSSNDVIERCRTLAKKDFTFIKLDLLDYEALCEVFLNNKIEVVLHFAALKSVTESVKEPLLYYQTNITGSINLLKAMAKYGVNKIVYSSSSTVYGSPQYLPLDELHPTGECINPYGFSKYVVEVIIRDHMKQTNGSYIHLRYFNPVGAHKSAIIGESPSGIPNNLFPYVSDVAVGKRDCLYVYGNNYNTIDGTGARDYIHVVDLAEGHVKAVEYINSNDKVNKIYNLGTGTAYSVLQVVEEYKKVCGKEIKYEIVGVREGDIDINYTDVSLAKKELGWSAKYDLKTMCLDAWNYIKNASVG